MLDQLAESTSESRSSLVERMLAEALRTEHHPLIRFRTGGSGRREPALIGTRHAVRQLVSQVRAADGDVDEIAEIMELPVASVRAVMAYYADFRDEIDAEIAWATAVEAEERARWDREQAVLT